MHRFFIPAEWLTPPTVTLYAEVARQVRTVLRMQPGDEILVLDNSGSMWQVRLIAVGKAQVEGELVAQQPVPGESDIHLRLYAGTLKGQKLEWVLQKGTELGVSEFVPLIFERSVVRKPQALSKKYERWRRIIQEAAEQSGRGKLPVLQPPLYFEAAVAQHPPDMPAFLAWETGTTPPLRKQLPLDLTRLALFVGPEGGITAQEVALALERDVAVVSLGPRIMRAETASLAFCTVVLYALGAWE